MSNTLDILVDIVKVGTGYVEIETKKPYISVKCRVPDCTVQSDGDVKIAREKLSP